MTNAWEFDENGQQDPNVSNGPKPLRDAYEAQVKANKDLASKIAALEAAVTKNAVADLIESQGVPRSAAQHYRGEADPEKISAWVSDMRTTFGGAPAQDAQAVVQPALSSDDQKRFEQMNQMGSNAAPATTMDVATQAVNGASSREELLAAFANLRA